MNVSEHEEAIPKRLLPDTPEKVGLEGSNCLRFTTADGTGTIRLQESGPAIVVRGADGERSRAQCGGDRAAYVRQALELGERTGTSLRSEEVKQAAMARLYDLVARIATDPAGVQAAMQEALRSWWEAVAPPADWDCACARERPSQDAPDELTGLRLVWMRWATVPWLDVEPASITEGDELEVHDRRFGCRAKMWVTGLVDELQLSPHLRRVVVAYRRGRKRSATPLVLGWIGVTRQVVPRTRVREPRRAAFAPVGQG